MELGSWKSEISDQTPKVGDQRIGNLVGQWVGERSDILDSGSILNHPRRREQHRTRH
jgi:hypothetical protein